MPESLLTILKFCLLGLVYLFFARVLRAVWVEVGGRGGREGGQGAAAPPTQRWGRGANALARLRVLEPPEDRGRSFELGDELTLGRAEGCQITLDDTFVSQLHARIFRRDDQIVVEDLGSTNGTFLNGQKVTAPVVVRRGDRLQVGKTVMELAS